MSEYLKYGSLRRLQENLFDIANQIVGETWAHRSLICDVTPRVCKTVDSRWKERDVVCDITPGGGKTLGAAIWTNELLQARVGDRVLYVVPTLPLVSQVQRGFCDPERGLLNKLLVLDVTKAQRLRQMSLEGRSVGFITTYAYLALNAAKVLAKMSDGHRWLLIFDEHHHLAEVEHRAWRLAAMPLCDVAKHVLAMSGTLRRHDGERIPLVRYEDLGGETFRAIPDVRYTRADALSEQAIVKVEAHLMDGPVGFAFATDGVRIETDLSAASTKRLRKAALRTAMSTDFRDEWALEGVSHLVRYRADHHYPSRAIVICHGQTIAKHVAKVIASRSGLSVICAVSKDKDAKKKLARFRAGEGDVLVTVKMASEGFDVRNVSHLIFLNNVESEPEIEQTFARATRFDPASPLPWAMQRAHIWAPRTQFMKTLLERMESEQDNIIHTKDKRAGAAAPPRGVGVIPLSGEKGSGYLVADGHELTADEHKAVEEVGERYQAHLLPLTARLCLARDLGLLPASVGAAE